VASLAPEFVEPLLTGRFGRPYLYVERCASTQRLFADGMPEGAVAVAEEQTAGRGRLGRGWSAPPGTSILVSIVLQPRVPLPQLPELSLVAGEAVAAAVAEAVGVEPEVKFPNDVLLGGRKVAGILAEAADGRVVLGIGVNVNQRPDELPPGVEATALRVAVGHELDRAPLLAGILAQLESSYDRWVSALAVSR
jgi:BirA family transcriptional regulator, biotin operon repressor / biotin---[acetyl-CoA-carboxylase] ligase